MSKKTSEETQVPGQEQAEEKVELTIEQKRKLFADYDSLEEQERVQRQRLEDIQAKKSDAVKLIFDSVGKGPFHWKGERLLIVERKGTYFFRGKTKKVEEEVIG